MSMREREREREKRVALYYNYTAFCLLLFWFFILLPDLAKVKDGVFGKIYELILVVNLEKLLNLLYQWKLGLN